MSDEIRYFSMYSGVGGFEYGIHRVFETNEKSIWKEDKKRIRTRKNTSKDERHTGLENSTPETLKHNINNSNRQFNCVGYSEIDKYAIAVYKYNYGEKIKNYGNADEINEKELPDFDLLVGGFPCQTFSVAGKRAGFDDTRGTQFFNIARIVRHKQPRFLVLKNVKGLLSHDNGKTFHTITSVLDELGYDVEWQVLNSKYHGVPQNRERVFIVGHLRGSGSRKIFPFTGENTGDTRTIERVGNVNPSGNGMNGEVYSDEGLSPTISTNKGEGSKIIQLNNPNHSQQRVYSPEGISPTLCAGNLGGGKSPTKIIQPRAIITPEREEKRQNGRRVKEPDEEMFTLTGQDQHGIIQSQGVASNRYYAIKNEFGTLKTRNHKNLNSAGANGVINGARIRRLAPIECERLQAFPDNWTKYGIVDGQVVEMSDTQRYKMMGNAVTTNVIRDIMLRLYHYDVEYITYGEQVESLDDYMKADDGGDLFE